MSIRLTENVTVLPCRSTNNTFNRCSLRPVVCPSVLNSWPVYFLEVNPSSSTLQDRPQTCSLMVLIQQVLFEALEHFCKDGALEPTLSVLPCTGGRTAERAVAFVGPVSHEQSVDCV